MTTLNLRKAREQITHRALATARASRALEAPIGPSAEDYVAATEIVADLAEDLVAEVSRLSQRPSVEDVARVFAGLGDDEPWPTNWELGGSSTGVRDDEFRSAHMADARRLIALFPTPQVQGDSA